MNLFEADPAANLLPFDGVVNYHGPIMSPEMAAGYLRVLLDTVPWKNDEVVLFGKRIITARKVAWYGDRDYSYSGTTKQALAWTPELLELKSLVKALAGASFNSCLLNLYHDGNEGMAWHSDNERSIVKDSAIASVSFGAKRKFAFKHKQQSRTIEVELESGSLLVMKDTTQTHWLHRLPKTTRVKEPRVNLTFRTMILD